MLLLLVIVGELSKIENKGKLDGKLSYKDFVISDCFISNNSSFT